MSTDIQTAIDRLMQLDVYCNIEMTALDKHIVKLDPAARIKRMRSIDYVSHGYPDKIYGIDLTADLEITGPPLYFRVAFNITINYRPIQRSWQTQTKGVRYLCEGFTFAQLAENIHTALDDISAERWPESILAEGTEIKSFVEKP